MTRRELKPGTVFKYKPRRGFNDRLFYVHDDNGNDWPPIPKAYRDAKPSTDMSSIERWDEPVDVFWPTPVIDPDWGESSL